MGPTNFLAQMTSSSIFVHLNMAWMKVGKSLIRRFNASESYQLVGRPLEAYQNPY